MERIQELIDQLNRQKSAQASPAQLLLTVKALTSELMKFQNRNGSFGTAKVAVTLPVHVHVPDEEAEIIQEVKTEAPPPPPQPKIPTPVEPPRTGYAVPKPQETPPPPKVEEPAEHQRYMPSYDPVEVPTLAQQGPVKDLHELISEKKTSLNDRLKEEKKEVAHILKETPIKDLRKGIGINDRFTFIRELFNGDETMYERSIKTINGFSILSEAEYWINRELKVKLGWNDNKEYVQHFYQLVRRRFA
jgi:hypothetical protein